MTDQEIRDLLDTYSFRATSGRRADGTPVFFAWYDELPGCLVESASREEARLELDAIAPAVLGQLSAEGVSLPRPSSARSPRTLTNILQFSGLVVGAELLTAQTTADLVNRPTVITRTMVTV